MDTSQQIPTAGDYARCGRLPGQHNSELLFEPQTATVHSADPDVRAVRVSVCEVHNRTPHVYANTASPPPRSAPPPPPASAHGLSSRLPSAQQLQREVFCQQVAIGEEDDQVDLEFDLPTRPGPVIWRPRHDWCAPCMGIIVGGVGLWWEVGCSSLP